MNKTEVDKLIEKLQKETVKEALSKTEGSCGANIKGYTCTRPKGHSGYHVACATDHFVAIWHFMLNDVLNEDAD